MSTFRLPRFATLSVLCITGMALAMGVVISFLLSRAVSDWEWENTAAVVRRQIEVASLETLFTGPPTQKTQQRWAQALSRLLSGLPEVAGLKVWDREGTVLWSDDERLIGRRFPENDELRRALEGQVTVEVKKLRVGEHPYEHGVSTLAEVYVPILSKETHELVGVLQVRKTPKRLLATIRWGHWIISAICLVGALALTLVIVPLTRQVYGREVREETLRAHARTLERDQRRLQDQLIQTEKVAAMGSLLAGVAHELNNPLAVVLGQAGLLRSGLNGHPLVGRVEKIEQAAERCARIVRNFLALARRCPPERQPLEVNQVIRDAVELLAYPLRVDDIEVTLDLAPGLPVLEGDPHQLHQVVVNLVTNAQQAMRGSHAPRQVTLTTRFDPATAKVAIEMMDTGPGIPPALHTQIFEPFFTTKPLGQGTGLGLSLCRGIIEGHGGTIRVANRKGGGAVFRIEVPVPAAAVAAGTARTLEASPRLTGKTILVVDDERDVAGVLADFLAADGHQVDTATDGLGALHKVRTGSYDLIISDMRMPHLDGPGLYEALRRYRPYLLQRVIFVSGDTLGIESQEFLERTGAPWLSKPFTAEEVRQVVQRVLDPPKPPQDALVRPNGRPSNGWPTESNPFRTSPPTSVRSHAGGSITTS